MPTYEEIIIRLYHSLQAFYANIHGNDINTYLIELYAIRRAKNDLNRQYFNVMLNSIIKL